MKTTHSHAAPQIRNRLLHELLRGTHARTQRDRIASYRGAGAYVSALKIMVQSEDTTLEPGITEIESFSIKVIEEAFRFIGADAAELLGIPRPDPDAGKLHLYHRTTPEAKAAILAEHRMVSEESTGEAYFSTKTDGHAVGYGLAVLHIVIPPHLVELEDEFPDGEQHYRVRTSTLRPEHFRED